MMLASLYACVLLHILAGVPYPSPQLLSVTSSSTNPRRSNPSKVTLSTPISCSQSPALPSTPSTSSMADTSDGIANRKRGLSFDTADTNPKRRRSSTYNSRQSGDKAQNKGLRHFSQRVCEKVRDKGTTTYNEVSSLCTDSIFLWKPCRILTCTVCIYMFDSIPVIFCITHNYSSLTFH